MSIELIGIAITGAISTVDLLVNCFQIAMSGSCSIRCCGSEIKHLDTEANLVDLTRRMSTGKNEHPTEEKSEPEK